MKRNSTLFLQGVIVLIGIGALAVMLWEPHLEGRNAHATLFEIYFKDPFLAYVYTVSILFFVALSQVFKILGYARQDKTFSHATVDALRTIKYCAIALVASIVGVEAYLFIVQRSQDDIAGGVVIGLFLMGIFITIATASSVLERVLKNAVNLSEDQ